MNFRVILVPIGIEGPINALLALRNVVIDSDYDLKIFDIESISNNKD